MILNKSSRVLIRAHPCVEYSVAQSNYAAPRNEHVGIIFHVNCPEASFFTVDDSFIFNFTSCVDENCFFELNKETSCDKVRKWEYEQDKSYVIEFYMFSICIGFHREK